MAFRQAEIKASCKVVWVFSHSISIQQENLNYRVPAGPGSGFMRASLLPQLRLVPVGNSRPDHSGNEQSCGGCNPAARSSEGLMGKGGVGSLGDSKYAS